MAEVLCARPRLLNAEDVSQMHLKYFFSWSNAETEGPCGFGKQLEALQNLSKDVRGDYAFLDLFGSDPVAPYNKEGERERERGREM